MIGSTRQVSVFAYGAPVDMRKGFDGLSALVEQELRRDPLSGDLFLFVNRGRRMAKVLLWDGTGLCVYSKRLETGQFACLWRGSETSRLHLTMSELQLFLEGSTWVGKVELSPPIFVRKALVFATGSCSNSVNDSDRERAER
ncbi:MAG: IS66 family insertion sequence element accessory protein TnpB [Acidobacteriota bacterium]|nr:IS66 family insertion sequence element accessory protein TnpB [Acidobacteriota bacterium]